MWKKNVKKSFLATFIQNWTHENSLEKLNSASFQLSYNLSHKNNQKKLKKANS